MKASVIHEFILADEQNFKIAAAVENAWSETVQLIVTGFMDALDTRLKNELPGWVFDRYQTCYVDSWASYYFWKPAWGELYGIYLAWGSHGAEMDFGVYRELREIKKRPHFDDVLAAVRKVAPSAIKRPWWEARIRMKHPASDWRSPDVLWRMRTDTTFLDEVFVQLLDVAKVSETPLDKSLKKYRK